MNSMSERSREPAGSVARMAPRADIEGLRALAVAAVVAYHAGVWGTAGGYVGVDVFFVVSGFLITSLLIREHAEHGRIDAAAFWARRARRLLPIASTVVIATVIAGWLILPMTERPRLGRDALASSLFSANWVFAERGTDYLASDTDPSPLQHFWSLGVEEQFYAVWPLLVMVAGVGLIGAATTERLRRRLIAVAACAAIGSFTLSVATSGTTRSWAYFGTHTRVWELGVGVLGALCWPTITRLPQRWRTRAAWCGVAGIVLSVATYGGVASFPGWVAVVPVVATLAVLAGDDAPHGPHAVLSWRPLQWLGAHSYGLYLWHWPALILGAEAIGDSGLAVAAMVALAVTLSAFSLRWIENPVRHAAALVSNPRRSLWTGAATVVLAGAISLAAISAPVGVRTGVIAASPAAPTATPALTTTTTTAPTPHSAPVAAPTTVVPPQTTTTVTPTTTTTTVPIGNLLDSPAPAVRTATTIDAVPDNLRPSLATASNDLPEVYSNGCHGYMSTRANRDCVTGDESGTVTIGLWGDSHAAQWFGPMSAAAERHGWRLASFTSGGCPVIDRLTWNRGADSDFWHCAPWRDDVIDALVEADADVVVISQHWGLLDADDRQPIGASEWEQLLPELVDRLRANDIEPILFMDSPDPPESVPACLSRNTLSATNCAAVTPGTTESQVRATQILHAALLDIAVVDPHRWLCIDVDTDATLCPAVIGDMLVYRDGHHLTATAAMWLADLVDDVVSRSVTLRAR